MHPTLTRTPLGAAARLAAGLGLAGVLTACSAGGGGSASSTSAPASPAVTVMTRNMYFGADLSPLFNATAAQLGADATAAYQQIQNSQVPARIESDATEIAHAGPDLVALQEAVVVSTTAEGQKTPSVQYDFVTLLQSDLARLGMPYKVAASNDGFSGALPVPGVGLVGLQDRDVILVRNDSKVSVSNPTSGLYQHALTVNVAGIPITVKRGWTAVDASMSGRNFRLIATHLEAYADPTRDAQANELLSLIGTSATPVLVLGDVNSAAQGAGSQTYSLMRGAGLGDAWAAAHPANPGFTCCRSADLRSGSLDQRIDMVFYRGGFTVKSAIIVGADSSDRTTGGVWPSDHAGVVASLTPPA